MSAALVVAVALKQEKGQSNKQPNMVGKIVPEKLEKKRLATLITALV